MIALQHLFMAFCLFGAAQLTYLMICHAYDAKLFLHGLLSIHAKPFSKFWSLYFLLADNIKKAIHGGFLTKYKQVGW